MKKFRLKFCSLSIVIFLAFVMLRSARGADFQTWSDITTIYRFADGWRYDGDQGVRGVLSDSDFTLLFFRPSVRYRVKPWFTVHGGIRFFKTFFDDEDDTFEIGPWQGLRFVGPVIGGYAISQYLRFEERMIWQTEGDSDFDFTLRTRYQLGARSPNYDILFSNGVYLLGSIEAFSNIERPIFVNRIRYDLGTGSQVSDAWRVQLHYLMHHDRQSASAAFTATEHILRLRLFYTFE